VETSESESSGLAACTVAAVVPKIGACDCVVVVKTIRALIIHIYYPVTLFRE